MLRQSVSRLASKNGRGVANRLNRPSSAMWSTTPRMACQISARGTIHRAIRSVCTPPSKIPIFSFSRSMATQVSQNPFLDWHLFPDFQHLLTQCKPATAVPIFEKFLNNAEERFKQLEKSFTPTWEGSIGLMQQLEDDITRAYGILSHFNGVKNSDDIRQTLESLQPKIVKLGLLLNQSLPKYNALVKLRESETAWNSLDAVQKRIIDQTLRDMKHAGVGFAPNSPKKKRYNEIRERLSKLSLTFGNHVLDATKAYKEVVDRSYLTGLSDTFLETLSKNAKRLGIEQEGAYCITLDFPIYGPFMQNCSNRELREKVYKANIGKASQGELDNEPIINEILALRQEEAELLGYKNYADLSLSVKMAQTVPAAEDLLDRLFTASVEPAKKELDDLTKFAEEMGHPTPLKAWDITYVSEQYRKHLFKYDEETIAQYFALPKVLDGLFAVSREVLGIDVEEMDAAEQRAKGMTTWHPDVKVFKVTENGEVRAYFYGDFYSRPEEKRSGAWMDTVTTRAKDENGSVRIPVAYLICNQPAPSSPSEPSLMKFRDVETLFHEFGHCLQHMLTTVDYPQASGINGVEWDFVEVASQFMENFCSEREWLHRLSGHYKTGEPMEEDMVNALIKNREFLSGLATLRQLHFSKVDLLLHAHYNPSAATDGKSVFEVEAEVAKKTVLYPRVPEDRFLCSFSHIFGGGYAAGYYSYKWSETYSADAYAAFEEAAAQSNKQGVANMGKLYRNTVLALGGGTPPQDVWQMFRGRREVEIDALLRHSGLAKTA
ncbi:hypothetical protein NQZ79_g3920 [Umbelopsis isabellina]|nr:hypothetical protein NQZ79_g3920 [Umbelopsis isabellina]